MTLHLHFESLAKLFDINMIRSLFLFLFIHILERHYFRNLMYVPVDNDGYYIAFLAARIALRRKRRRLGWKDVVKTAWEKSRDTILPCFYLPHIPRPKYFQCAHKRAPLVPVFLNLPTTFLIVNASPFCPQSLDRD